MQNEPPSVQVPDAPHDPEQQSPSTLQALPAVLQALLSVPHAPLTQLPLQHWASDVHLRVSETQVLVEHLPPTQLSEQQSVAAAQACPADSQSLTTDTHLSVFGSQMPEQHSELCTQTVPNGLHWGPP
jgi:hypothetical protein